MLTAFFKLLKLFPLYKKCFVFLGVTFLLIISFLIYTKTFKFPEIMQAGAVRNNSLKHSKITPTPTLEVTPTNTPQLSPTQQPIPTNNLSPSQATTPTPTQSPITYSLKLGIVVNDYANKYGELSSLEQQLGKPISTVSIFKQFGSKYNNMLVLDDLSYVKSKGMKLQLSWEPWNPDQGMNQSVDYLKEIPEGKQDGYLRTFASQVKSYGNPVVIRFGHEMNGNWYPWGNRPAEYIQAYRYIVALFRNEGINNATWMFAVNAENVPSSPISTISQFYPNDDVVDVIGIDGFNFGTSTSFGSWRSFTNIFSPAYNFLANTYNKPIVIAETASSEMGGNKADWIRNVFNNELPANFPKVSELIWFNLLKETDWRINSSDSSLQAFIQSLP